MATADRAGGDVFASGRLGPALWGALVAVFLLDLLFDLDPPVEATLWAIPLTAYGLACSVNALRCGRIHCYFTGPFLLAVAALVLLLGFGFVDLGPDGGRWLVLVVVAGFAILRYLPERRWGRYSGGHR